MISTGTCSWTEKTLLRSGFYPREASSAESRLRFYASRFDTVEVDSTYYAIPDPRTAMLWDMRTPANFTFHIKVHGALTGHGIDPRTLPADLQGLIPPSPRGSKFTYVREQSALEAIARRLAYTLMPLKAAGKLGLLVFQFPPWFTYGTSSMNYILRCEEMMGDFSLGVEFRHGSWLTPDRSPSVFRFLRTNRLTYIAADEPQYGNLSTIPFLPRVTTDTAYFRFHGRNRENWQKKGIETALRYAYQYSDGELSAFVPAVRDAGEQTRTTYAMFNNCYGDYAVRNATRLKQLLNN